MPPPVPDDRDVVPDGAPDGELSVEIVELIRAALLRGSAVADAVARLVAGLVRLSGPNDHPCTSARTRLVNPGDRGQD